MKREERLRKKHEELQEQYELAGEKVNRLAKALIIETDPARHLQQEEQLKQAKSLRDSLEQELDSLEQQIGGPEPPKLVNERVWAKDGKVMVRVPAGTFLYGDNEKSLTLPEFWIDKTPVTNAEYKRFIDAAYPQQAVPYVEANWAKPYNWDRQTRTFPAGKENHPVVLVSWHDAWDYARWAGKVLPTEQQWEKAARGPDGRAYPWDNRSPTPDLCNFDRNVGSTTPVGRYSPLGDSPYGCVDMSGNVWEWTNSDWDKSGRGKVLRGGSWDINDGLVRAANRFSSDPAFRFVDIGLRCAQE